VTRAQTAVINAGMLPHHPRADVNGHSALRDGDVWGRVLGGVTC